MTILKTALSWWVPQRVELNALDVLESYCDHYISDYLFNINYFDKLYITGISLQEFYNQCKKITSLSFAEESVSVRKGSTQQLNVVIKPCSVSLTSLIYLKEWRKDKIKSIYLIKIFIGYLFIKSFSFVIMILIDNWIILNWVTLFKRIVSHEIANLVTFNKRLSIYFIITLFLSILINFHILI